MTTREELYELVWSIPMTKVAEKFAVSGTYMARVCSALEVPRPERGYWAKLEVGKAPPRPQLPEASPSNQLSWLRGDDLSSSRFHATKATSAPHKARVQHVLSGIHALVQGAKQHFEKGYKVESGQLLRPYKRQLVDVTASASGLDKALAFASELFNALESAGARVGFGCGKEISNRPNIDEHETITKLKTRQHRYTGQHLWRPSSPTIAYVKNVRFGLAVIEMTEEVLMRYVNGKYIRESEYEPTKRPRSYGEQTWTTTKDIPCGRLRLIVYSPHLDVAWSMSFQETKKRTLTQDVSRIVKSIKRSTEDVQKEIHEADHRAELRIQQWEAQQERWRREEDQKQIAWSVRDSREQLSQAIEAWSKAVSIEQFFKQVEERAGNLPETERAIVEERLRLAREFIGMQDPFKSLLSWKTPGERYVPLDARS
ncbi:MAG: hypothetical protein JST28_09930 [Acidobacteria bacterium]|nr:hypothetical protein [Acidobacteriota bacterium]